MTHWSCCWLCWAPRLMSKTNKPKMWGVVNVRVMRRIIKPGLPSCLCNTWYRIISRNGMNRLPRKPKETQLAISLFQKLSSRWDPLTPLVDSSLHSQPAEHILKSTSPNRPTYGFFFKEGKNYFRHENNRNAIYLFRHTRYVLLLKPFFVGWGWGCGVRGGGEEMETKASKLQRR